MAIRATPRSRLRRQETATTAPATLPGATARATSGTSVARTTYSSRRTTGSRRSNWSRSPSNIRRSARRRSCPAPIRCASPYRSASWRSEPGYSRDARARRRHLRASAPAAGALRAHPSTRIRRHSEDDLGKDPANGASSARSETTCSQRERGARIRRRRDGERGTVPGHLQRVGGRHQSLGSRSPHDRCEPRLLRDVRLFARRGDRKVFSSGAAPRIRGRATRAHTSDPRGRVVSDRDDSHSQERGAIPYRGADDPRALPRRDPRDHRREGHHRTHGCRGRARSSGGAAAASAEDGGDRASGRGDRARLQQHSHGNSRVRGAGSRTPGSRGQREAQTLSRSGASIGSTRAGPDPAAADLRPRPPREPQCRRASRTLSRKRTTSFAQPCPRRWNFR